MPMQNVRTTPIEGQKPGTSGLRKKTAVFRRPHFLENYVQSIFDGTGGVEGKTLVIGGDGRFFNDAAIQIILRMACANSAAKCVVGQGGLLSTPAASHLIRLRKADGGLILSASHNPGGPDADFGLKYNGPNGGPATEALTDKIYECTKTLVLYKIAAAEDLDLHKLGSHKLENMVIEIVDPVADYADLMQTIVDFPKIRQLFADGFTMCFDAMHAVTGPYAHTVLEDMLGAPKGTVINGQPSPDFGKGHPDPNPIWAKTLMDKMHSADAPDFGAASDGDGDRNMIVGRGAYVTPSDSLALLTAHAHLAPGYRDGLAGVARSMPTSRAVDRVAESLGIGCFETPTGWKFFGNLLDAGKVTLCGEESAGTGSDHVREKDGLWAVLLWLNILAETGKSVSELMADLWKAHGRCYYSRLDFEGVDSDKAMTMMDRLRAKLDGLAGSTIGGLTVAAADEFAYLDPVDGSQSTGQGIRITFAGDARAVFRLSGTGTQGATIRLYLEQLETNTDRLQEAPDAVLTAVRDAALTLSDLVAMTGRSTPDVIT
ncbi:alpha-D-glucose phosphate-specific phosphoglucomutase [Roseobacter sp. CCS2]|uniref:alpha-D-glucose phosphate-specific phosphoglucomutase n=1 Tax=Roseobacter sp. CCS2 TaxID=391593 RepID=UPI0000F3C667|nr:alpha-D-glucose phosphate-specific phosphoglucomutase [Roseobacter sp. CCS2]EBA11533.1 phosphoglucomutase/phosphomannomutase alpha/beta/alpha domain III [Roseobacter sp. CCS2]